MSPQQQAPFAQRALQAVFDLHVVLEAWFNASGAEDVATVTNHFAENFRIVSPLGKVTPFADFARALPNLRGARPGLKMEIAEAEAIWANDACAAVAYQEKQTLGTTVTLRFSTALLIADPKRPVPQWLHLQETWLEQP
jgi:hypothetical protein